MKPVHLKFIDIAVKNVMEQTNRWTGRFTIGHAQLQCRVFITCALVLNLDLNLKMHKKILLYQYDSYSK